jgi:hypothetical protein
MVEGDKSPQHQMTQHLDSIRYIPVEIITALVYLQIIKELQVLLSLFYVIKIWVAPLELILLTDS